MIDLRLHPADSTRPARVCLFAEPLDLLQVTTALRNFPSRPRSNSREHKRNRGGRYHGSHAARSSQQSPRDRLGLMGKRSDDINDGIFFAYRDSSPLEHGSPQARCQSPLERLQLGQHLRHALVVCVGG